MSVKHTYNALTRRVLKRLTLYSLEFPASDKGLDLKGRTKKTFYSVLHEQKRRFLNKFCMNTTKENFLISSAWICLVITLGARFQQYIDKVDFLG